MSTVPGVRLSIVDRPVMAAVAASVSAAALALAGCDLTCLTDTDLDGFISGTCGGADCDDVRAEVHPEAEEQCDMADWDCSGSPVDDACDADCEFPLGLYTQNPTLTFERVEFCLGNDYCEVWECGDGYRIGSPTGTVLSGTLEAYDADCQLTGALDFTDVETYCDSSSFSQHFGDWRCDLGGEITQAAAVSCAQ